MFEPDEYLFTKLAYYFKRRNRKKQESISHTVNLVDLKPRLTIFARAITGKNIEIFDAEREGGYKNNNFFFQLVSQIFQQVKKMFHFIYLEYCICLFKTI